MGPIQFAQNGIDEDRSWCVDASGNDAASVTAVVFGSHDLTLGRLAVHLQPVEILSHPIHRQVDRNGRFREGDDDLRMANLHLVAALRNVRALDGQVHRVRPKDNVRMGVEIQRLDALLAENDIALLALRRVQRDDVTSVGEEQIPGSRLFADARDVVHRIKSGMASALVRSYIPREK